MPAVGRFNGTPASISASEAPQTVHRAGAVRLGDFRDDAQRVRKFMRRRKHRTKGAPGEFAVADFAAFGAAHAASFADRVGREVVMQQKAFFVSSRQRVDILFVFAGTECGDDQRLGFAAGEQR